MNMRNVYLYLVTIISSVILALIIIGIILAFYSINHFMILKRPNKVSITHPTIPEGKICPFCGESRHTSLGVHGISYTKKEWYTHIFRIRKCSKDIFKCYTCNAKWQENYTSTLISPKRGKYNG